MLAAFHEVEWLKIRVDAGKLSVSSQQIFKEKKWIKCINVGIIRKNMSGFSWRQKFSVILILLKKNCNHRYDMLFYYILCSRYVSKHDIFIHYQSYSCVFCSLFCFIIYLHKAVSVLVIKYYPTMVSETVSVNNKVWYLTLIRYY